MNNTGEDRIVRATLPLRTKATLLMEDELRKSTLQKRYAVNESRYPGKLAFANHLLVEVKHEPQLLDRTISNNRQISKDIYEQIKEKANFITYAHKWKNRDLLMLDNKRFLHGRKQLSPVAGRDIVILQTRTTNFGYGVSTKNI